MKFTCKSELDESEISQLESQFFDSLKSIMDNAYLIQELFESRTHEESDRQIHKIVKSLLDNLTDKAICLSKIE